MKFWAVIFLLKEHNFFDIWKMKPNFFKDQLHEASSQNDSDFFSQIEPFLHRQFFQKNSFKGFLTKYKE